jgi:glycosyltransferase involved in cell wall biosynthesis
MKASTARLRDEPNATRLALGRKINSCRKQKPLITILLLCYNHQKFVAEAVEGVLAQTYSRLEIIIFDDCSQDQTAEIIERTLAKHPHRADVRFIRNPENMHSNIVVRTGLSMTKGEFVFVSHGDDVMLPNMVEDMADVWISEGVSLVTANAHYIDENSQSLDRFFRDPDKPADDSFETLATDGVNACCFGPTIGFERAIYEKFDWVPRYLRAYDIMYPFYAYLLKGARFISKPLLKYRVHGQNTSLSLRAERSNSFEKAKIEERIYLGHLAHATLMQEEMIRLAEAMPERYGQIAQRVLPMLTIQLAEQAKKLVRVSRQSGTLATDWRR